MKSLRQMWIPPGGHRVLKMRFRLNTASKYGCVLWFACGLWLVGCRLWIDIIDQEGERLPRTLLRLSTFHEILALC